MSDEAPLGTHGNPYKLRGDNIKIFQSTNSPAIIAGPAETGKTIACCLKLHNDCLTTPGAQGLVVRQTQASMAGSVLRTLRRVMGNHVRPGYVRIYGGETPERFIYEHNGACIWVGGMDNENSVLSAERDFIYVNQSEELTRSGFEVLQTRCTGRGAVTKHPQLYGDCNPSSSKHWIREMAAEGKLTLLNATHRDNPSLYDDYGNLTPQGERTMAVLSSLTGVRGLRLYRGIWSTAEGAVYDEFNPGIHVCERKESEMVAWYLCMDFGFSDPAVVLLVGADYDRRWHVFREFYQSNVLPEYHMSIAAEWSAEKMCEFAACDGARPEFVSWLQAKGVNAIGVEKGPGSIEAGVALMKNRLHPIKADTTDGFLDGRPRLTVSSFCTNTIAEFEAYAFKTGADKHGTDKPQDKDNHVMDSLRYLAMQIDQGTGAFDSSSKIYIPPVTATTRIFTPRSFTPRQL